jgi:hypothetical protein
LPAITDNSAGDVVIQGAMYPLNITPTFDHGYLAAYEKGGGITVNVDIDSDGTVAAAVHSHDSLTGDIRLFSPDGSQSSRIATGPYLPSQVCFAPDHSIWALGNQDPLLARNRTDYSLLRHYSRTGDLLGEFFPRSSLPVDSDPGQNIVGMWRLRIAGRPYRSRPGHGPAQGAVVAGNGSHRRRNRSMGGTFVGLPRGHDRQRNRIRFGR